VDGGCYREEPDEKARTIRVRASAVRCGRLTGPMLSKDARRVEAVLASLLREEPEAVRNYVVEVLEERLWRGGEDRTRPTGFRFVRGSHGGTYVRDPAGTDVLPAGAQPPPEHARRRPA
jgi:hypothetical protein